MATAVSAQELGTSFDCRTVDCTGTAAMPGGLCPRCTSSRSRRPSIGRGDRVGLTLPGDLDYEEWKDVVRRMARVADSSRWWLADALAFGGLKYEGSKYRFAVLELGLSLHQAKKLGYVARSVHRPRRRHELTFTHHRHVAPLPPHEQSAWLERAVASGWTADKLAAELRLSRAPVPLAVELLKRLHLTISAPPERVERWSEAAAARGLTLGELACEALDLMLERVDVDGDRPPIPARPLTRESRRALVADRLARGDSVRQIAREHGLHRSTVRADALAADAAQAR